MNATNSAQVDVEYVTPGIVYMARKHRGRHGYLGLSENSVPLNPMVNDHYPY